MTRPVAGVVPFQAHELPSVDTLPDDDTDERHHYVTHADLDGRLAPILERLDAVLHHVGPDAQRHRSRREAAFLASAVVGVGCLGLGALDLQGASEATIAILGGLVLAAVVAIAAVLGRVPLTAKAPGVSIGAGGATDGSSP